MRCIYAYYSKPFGSIDIRRAETHWVIPHIEILTIYFSVLKSKEFGFETVLFCDKYGKELLIDTFEIPFDIVKCELDFCETKLRWWASGKIYAYTKGIESLGGFCPFVMMDNDAGWLTKPPAHFLKSLYRCQSIHIDKGSEFESNVLRLVRETNNEYPFDVFHEMVKSPDGVKGGNAGVLVIGSEELWKEFTRYTWDLMNNNWFDRLINEQPRILNPYKAIGRWNVVVEENLMFQLSRRILKQQPETIYEFTGFIKPIESDNNGFFHIWGRKKNKKFLRDFEEYIIPYIGKEFTEKVYKYFYGSNKYSCD